mmetsp:Transcript_40607/g.91179  ORF Transcript_40607/g.91179 Transcript_40607/m.91179 type:complete len:339 (-) Transcript_40607:7-1023(-)
MRALCVLVGALALGAVSQANPLEPEWVANLTQTLLAEIGKLDKKIDALRNDTMKMNSDTLKKIEEVRNEIHMEKHFATQALERLKPCSTPIYSNDGQKPMMLSKLIFKGRAFVVTAAHNLQFLPPGWQKPDVHTGWFFHPFRDIAAALLKNGSEVQDTCAATDLTFEVGERVVMYCPNQPRTLGVGHIVGEKEATVDYTRNGTLKIDAHVHPGFSGCSASNHAWLGIAVAEDCLMWDNRSVCIEYAGAVVPAQDVIDLLTGVVFGFDFMQSCRDSQREKVCWSGDFAGNCVLCCTEGHPWHGTRGCFKGVEDQHEQCCRAENMSSRVEAQQCATDPSA